MRAREARCNNGGEGETVDEEREAGVGGEHEEGSGGVAACLPPEISCVVRSEGAAVLDEMSRLRSGPRSRGWMILAGSHASTTAMRQGRSSWGRATPTPRAVPKLPAVHRIWIPRERVARRWRRHWGRGGGGKGRRGSGGGRVGGGGRWRPRQREERAGEG